MCEGTNVLGAPHRTSQLACADRGIAQMTQTWKPWTDERMLHVAALAAEAPADSKDFV